MQQICSPDVYPVMRIPVILLFLFLGSLRPVSGQSTALVNDSGYVYRSLQEARQFPERVFRLNLSRQRLDSIPPEIFTFTNLRELDLSRNQIDSLPAAIGNLVFLERLSLSNNQLTEVPREIGRLRQLVYLGLNRNQIVRLPETIGDLERLEVFELWDNELEDVPDEIAKLQNLRVLELRGILFTQEQQTRIDQLVVKSAKVNLSPSCNCK
jgi:Leucine-rich repeat (LRR) protein